MDIIYFYIKQINSLGKKSHIVFKIEGNSHVFMYKMVMRCFMIKLKQNLNNHTYIHTYM